MLLLIIYHFANSVSQAYALCLHLMLAIAIVYIAYLLFTKKKSEEKTKKISKDHEFLSQILDNLPFPIYIKNVDDDYRFIYWNKTTEGFTGIHRTKILGKTDFDLYPDSERAKAYRAIDESIVETGETRHMEEDYVTKDGKVISSAMIKSLIINTNKERWILSARWDLTPIKKSEQELIKAQKEIEAATRRQNLALKSINFGLVYLDTNYTVQWESTTNISHIPIANFYRPGEICYKTVNNREEPCQNCPLRTAMTEKRPAKLLRQLDGVDVEIIATPIFDESNENVIGGLLRVDDITEKLKIDQTLQEAKEKAEESNRLKSAFLANMSHEIRTPLNAIVGFSDIISQTDDLNERDEYMKIISSNNELLLQLINDILDLSKIEAGILDFRFTDIDLNDMLGSLCQQMELKNPNPEVEIKFTESIPGVFINSDKSRISQVLINFINNAMKFTKKGSIHFGYRVLENGDLYMFVKDTGMGIPTHKTGDVFERFVKLNDHIKGTGLGLSISRVIIENLDGNIGVQSVEKEGSEFWFTIPARSVTLTQVY